MLGRDSEARSPLEASSPVKDAEREVRMGFVRKVYGILSVQLLLTTAIAAPLSLMTQAWIVSHQWLLLLSCVMTLATICAMSCCQEICRRFPTNYVFLFVFTGFEGVTVGFVTARYTWQSVTLAAGITCLIFLAMTLFACCTKRDFTGCGPYLFGALMCLLFFGLLTIVLSFFVDVKYAVMALDCLGAVIFTFYIVYDTQLILGGNHQVAFSIDDYCFAALNLYLDIINLFLYILALFGKRDR